MWGCCGHARTRLMPPVCATLRMCSCAVSSSPSARGERRCVARGTGSRQQHEQREAAAAGGQQQGQQQRRKGQQQSRQAGRPAGSRRAHSRARSSASSRQQGGRTLVFVAVRPRNHVFVAVAAIAAPLLRRLLLLSLPRRRRLAERQAADLGHCEIVALGAAGLQGWQAVGRGGQAQARRGAEGGQRAHVPAGMARHAGPSGRRSRSRQQQRALACVPATMKSVCGKAARGPPRWSRSTSKDRQGQSRLMALMQSYTLGSYCSASPSPISSPGSHTWGARRRARGRARGRVSTAVGGRQQGSCHGGGCAAYWLVRQRGMVIAAGDGNRSDRGGGGAGGGALPQTPAPCPAAQALTAGFWGASSIGWGCSSVQGALVSSRDTRAPHGRPAGWGRLGMPSSPLHAHLGRPGRRLALLARAALLPHCAAARTAGALYAVELPQHAEMGWSLRGGCERERQWGGAAVHTWGALRS